MLPSILFNNFKMRSGIRRKISLLLMLLVVLFATTVNCYGNATLPDPAYPNSIKSTYRFKLTLKVRISNDSAFIQFRAQTTSATSFDFGDAQFIIRLDASIFDLSKAKIISRGKWDAANNPVLFNPLQIAYSVPAQALNLSIHRLGAAAPVYFVPIATDALIGEVYVPVKTCGIANTILTWINPINIEDSFGGDIANDASTFDASTAVPCPCDAAWSGLDTVYCTSSYLSKLKPKVSGGRFVGKGVNFAAGIWYFKAFDAGPGKHTIQYILPAPCNDTVSQSTIVNAAPCISTSNQDSTNGFTYLPNPQGIATDCNGEIYTTSGASFTIIKIDTFGIKQTIAGRVNTRGYVDGDTSIAKFQGPVGITIDNALVRNVYVVDNSTGGFRVRKINQATSTVSTVAGGVLEGNGTLADDGDSTNAKFLKSVGICFSSDYTKLYVSEGDGTKNTFRIREIDVATKKVKTIAGGNTISDIDGVFGISRFRQLGHLSADANYLYVADVGNNKIKRVDLKSGNYRVETIVGKGPNYTDGDSSVAQFIQPYSASVGMNGDIYVADFINNVIRKVTQFPHRTVSTIAGIYNNPGKTDSTFSGPICTSVFVKGFIDVVDYNNNRIRRVAIQDYGNLPFENFDTSYCTKSPKDTLPYVVGSYSGPGVFTIGGRWYFSPDSVKTGPGTYRICYSYNLNQCNATFCKDIIIHPNPNASFPVDSVICSNILGRFQLDAGTFVSYQWYKGLSPSVIIPGATKRALTTSSIGTYSVLLKDQYGCPGGDTLTIDSIAPQKVSLGPDKTLCAGDSVRLDFTNAANIQSFLWQDSSSASPYYARGGGVYFVNVIDTYGCLSSDTIFVHSVLPPTPLITSAPAEKCVAFVKTTSVFPPEPTFLTPQLQGMVKDRKGNIYVTDFKNNLIRKIDVLGNKTIYAGAGNNVFGTNVSTVQLTGPYGITIDKNQNLYITEVTANIVRKITPQGKVSIYAGVYGLPNFNGDGRKDTVQLSQPTAIDVDDAGNIYITEYAKNIVRKISALGYTQVIGDSTSSGNATGNYANARFNKPIALTIDKGGYVYVADLNNTIKKLDPFNKKVSAYASISVPSINIKGIVVDNLKRMYITMNSNYALYYIDPRDSSTQYYAGVISSSGSQDGLMSQAKFNDLEGLYIDENGGALYAVDKDRIRNLHDSCSVDICEGSVAHFDVGPGYFSHQWNNNPALNTRYDSAKVTGDYFVKVTNQNGCAFYDTIHVNMIPKPLLTVSKDTSVCYGGAADFTAKISPIGPKDTLEWRYNNVVISRTIGTGTNTIHATAIGTYVAEVKTGKLCSYSKSSVLTINNPIVDAGKDTSMCTNSFIQLNASVNNNPSGFTFKWIGDNLNNTNIANPKASPQTVNDSVYYVRVIDQLGCRDSDTVIVHLRQSPVVRSIKDTLICIGNKVPLLTNITGGKQPYTIVWSPSLGLDNQFSQNPIASPLDTSIYFVNVSDATGCKSKEDTVKIGVIKLTVSATASPNPVCPGVVANLNANVLKGSGNYAFQWTPANNISDPAIMNPTVKADTTRAYTVSVRDITYHCPPIFASVTLNVFNFSVEAGKDSSICFGTTIPLNALVKGGLSPFVFSWTPSADLNNSNIPNPIDAPSLSGKNRYIVHVTDKNNCTVEDTIFITSHALPLIAAAQDTLICSNTSMALRAKASGGNAPYIYSWKNSMNAVVIAGNPVNVTLSDSVIYTVTVKDANNCNSLADTLKAGVIKIKVKAGTASDTVCAFKPVLLKALVSGGLGATAYLWKPAFYLDDAFKSNPIATVSAATTFYVVAKDSLGCKDSSSVTINVSELTVNTGKDTSTCLGNSVALSSAVTGGAKPYTYAWTPSSGLSNAGIPMPLVTPATEGAKEYVLKVTDKNSCTDSDTTLVMVFGVPVVTAGKDTVICKGTQATLNASSVGGKNPLTYSWTNDLNVAVLSGNPVRLNLQDSMSYFVTVKDTNNCLSQRDTLTVKVVKLQALATATPSTVCADQPAQLDVMVTGNLGKVIYAWKPAQYLDDAILKNPSAKVGTTTTFKAIVKDSLGCIDSASVNVSVVDLTVDVGSIVALCEKDSIRLNGVASGGSSGYTYSWTPATFISNPAVADPKVSPPVDTTVYVLKVTDQGGCEKKDSVLVVVHPLPLADAGPDTLAACKGLAITVGGNPSASGGGGAPYVFQWTSLTEATATISDPAKANPDALPLKSAVYLLSVKDALGCQDWDSIFIKVNPLPDVSISANKSIACEKDTILLSVYPYPGSFDISWTNFATSDVLGNDDKLKVTDDGVFQVNIRNIATGCFSFATAPVNFIDLPKSLSIDKVSNTCINIPIALNGHVKGDQLVYSWKTINGSGTFSNPGNAATMYFANQISDPLLPAFLKVQFKVSNQCKSDSVSIDIGLNPVVKPSFTADPLKTFPGDLIAFTNTTDTAAKGVKTFKWLFNDGDSLLAYQASHAYKETGTYNAALVAENLLGCKDTFYVLIDILKTQILFVPNAFAPAEPSENNKTLKVYGQNVQDTGFQFTIYNRWGQQVFSTGDRAFAAATGWNGMYQNTGDEQPMGVYTYVLKGKFRDGKQFDTTGTVTLIR